MISFEDRMALVRAGYTATQIAEFDSQLTQTEQTEQTEQTQTEQTQTEQTQTEQTQTEQTKQTDFAAMMQSINNSMAAMLTAMQAQNIKSATMNETPKETPSDILAKLLNP